MSSFFEYFVEQGFVQHLAWLGAAALVVTGLIVGAWAAVGSWRRSVPWYTVGLAVGVTLLTFAGAVVLFEGAALYLRHVPYGNGGERHLEDYRTFVFNAKLLLAALYAAALLAAALIGLGVARAFGERSARLPLLTAATLVLFMVVSLPYVDFMNACNVGQPFVLSPTC